MKLLTIVIPSYNMEVYLRTCLDSLVVPDAAVLDKLDVIVVNDGSTDTTSAIAHEFATKYPNVFRVIDKPNGHYGSCVNRGLAEAKGAYVRILDADDMVDTVGFSRYLVELAKLATQDAPVDLIWTDYRLTDAQRIETDHVSYALSPNVRLSLDALTDMPQDRSMPSATYRRAIFTDLGYHQTEGVAYTDAEWMFLPMSAVRTAVYLPITVYSYMLGRTDQSMNASVLGKQLAMLRQVFFARLESYCTHRNTWSAMSLRYAQSELTRAATGLYRMHLQAGVFSHLHDLCCVDRRIAADIPELLSRIGETDVMFSGKPFAIPYGKICARHPFSRPFLALALKAKACLNS